MAKVSLIVIKSIYFSLIAVQLLLESKDTNNADFCSLMAIDCDQTTLVTTENAPLFLLLVIKLSFKDEYTTCMSA